MTASLPASPSRIRGTTEVQLQGVVSPTDAPTTDGIDDDTTSTDVLGSLASVDENASTDTVEETEEELVTASENEEPWRTIIAAPPTIRRRRKPSDNNGEPSRSLSFMEQTDSDMNDEFQSIIKEETMIFPVQSSRKAAGLTTTPACRAICFLIITILLLCVLLSHYYTSSSDEHPPSFEFRQETSMTLSEQQILLKSYLGVDLHGSSSCSATNVKLPAGGNPIDLVHLLHSSTNNNAKEEEEAGENISTASKQDVRLAILLILTSCTIMHDR